MLKCTALGPSLKSRRSIAYALIWGRSTTLYSLMDPYFYQDVSYGNKVLTLDNGDRIEMPNVVRILTRSTMIEQYLDYCKKQCHEPLSRSTLFKILEVREASQSKSL